MRTLIERVRVPLFSLPLLAALLTLAISATVSAQTPSSCKTSGFAGYVLDISYDPIANRTTYNIEIVNLTPQAGVYVNIGEVYIYGLPSPLSTASPVGWAFSQVGGKTFWSTTSNPWWKTPPAIKPFGDLEGFHYVINGPPGTVTAIVCHLQPVTDATGRTAAGSTWFDCSVPTGDECIAVAKSANPTSGPAGTLVTYTITVSNCGQDVMTGMAVNDTLLGDITPQFIAANGGSDNLAVAASVTFAVARTILDTDPQSLTNTAVACGIALGEEETCGDASATVTVEKPCIHIAKIIDPVQALVGDSVSYIYTVSNCGNVPVLNVTVSDSLLGDLTPPFVAANGGSTLAVSASVTFSSSRTVLNTDPNPLVNIVTVSGQDSHGTPVTDETQASVEILPDPPPADVSIAGTAYNNVSCSGLEDPADPPLAGATFRLTYTDGTFPVIDANSNPVPNQTGSSFNFVHLVPGNYRVVAFPPAGFVSTNAIPGLCGGTKIADDILQIPATTAGAGCVDNDFLACQPNLCIHVDKTADPAQGMVGTPITYGFRVTNCGNSPFSGVTVIDTLLGDITSEFVAANQGSDTLAVGGSVQFTVTRVIESSDPVSTVNTVTVCGVSRSTQICGSDAATVTVLKPCIHIAKTAEPPQAQVGQTVQYDYTVSNCGDVPISNVTVNDTLLGSLTALFVAANGGSSTLAVGGVVPFTTSRAIQAGDPNPLVNVVTVSGQDPHSNPVSGQAQDQVQIIPDPPPAEASIAGGAFKDLDCSGVRDPADTPLGATFRLTYTDGSYPVIDINTNPVADQSGTTYNFTALVPGTYRVVETNPNGYTSTNALPGSCAGTTKITNDILEVPATPGGTACINNDFLDCQPSPCIHIAKSVSPADAPVGTVVTYFYHVQNCGNVLLSDISVVDTLLGNITAYYIAAHGDDTLDPGGIVNFSVQHRVTSDQPNPLDNIVTVTGIDPFGTDVSSTDDGRTTIPITISGMAYWDHNCDGVLEPDDKPLPNTVFHLTDTQGNPVTDIFGNIVAPFTGSSYAFQNLRPGVYVVTKEDQPGFVSTNALPGFNAVKLNDDQIQVNAVVHTNYPNNDFLDCYPHSCISLACKITPPIAKVGDTVTSSPTICNCGNQLLTDVQVHSNQFGDLTRNFIAANGGSDSLEPGKCVNFSVTKKIEPMASDATDVGFPSEGEVVEFVTTVTARNASGEVEADGKTCILTVLPGPSRTRRCFLPVTFTTDGWTTFCDPNNAVIPGGMVYNRFPRAFANWTFYGKPVNNQLIVGYRYTITFNGISSGLKRLCLFLSQSAPCGALKRSYVDPWQIAEAGSLAEETVTLMMNIAYNDQRLMPRTAGYDLENFTVAKGVLKGKRVGQVLDIANRVLGGAPPCQFGFKNCSDLQSVIESINANYEFVDYNTFIDQGYLIPNRTLGEPDPPHSPVVP